MRIAVLGGSTTNELVDFWQLYLLHEGFLPVFHQSEYGQFYEEAVVDTEALQAFAPNLVYVHTSYRNVIRRPSIGWSEDDLRHAVQDELARYRQIWDSIERSIGCQVIQNNFELPPIKTCGSLDAVVPGGAVRFFLELNLAFATNAVVRSNLTLNDVMSLSAELGARNWFDSERWFSYKLLLTPEAHVAMARSLTAIVRSLYGRARKVLILDLDNTVWGGVIGDDGVDRIQVGTETPVAEAFTDFQKYCVQLRDRGVLLAVCSKNDDAVARGGFEHPDSVLKLEHFSAFYANWEPKHENILSIARELNLGVDSLVFVDDNPAERALVAAQLPDVAVPEISGDPASYIATLQAGRYFEAVSISSDDLARAEQYAGNAQRLAAQSTFSNYGEYLDSLLMTAEIRSFLPVYLARITQLTNKTNQFNLTTRRYTLAEMERITKDPGYIGLYGRLTDRFGDNGLVSVVVGSRKLDELHIDLWLMSCRVLKREMELAMLDALVEEARLQGVTSLVGLYLPTKKNGMVADFYERIGFTRTGPTGEGGSTYSLDIISYAPRTKHIVILSANGIEKDVEEELGHTA